MGEMGAWTNDSHLVGRRRRRNPEWPRGPRLFSAQRDNDFLVAAAEDDAAILDAFDRDLESLCAHLQTELLTFDHGLAVNDGEVGALIEGDGGDGKGGERNIAPEDSVPLFDTVTGGFQPIGQNGLRVPLSMAKADLFLI